MLPTELGKDRRQMSLKPKKGDILLNQFLHSFLELTTAKWWVVLINYICGFHKDINNPVMINQGGRGVPHLAKEFPNLAN